MAQPEDILSQMRVPGSDPPLYLVGCRERRVTIYAQQLRALNLAWAIHAAQKPSTGASIVVVGGGIAGLTISAALAIFGYKVTVLEQETLLWVQEGSPRWVHPRIYDWPLCPDALESDARLPLLTWTAGRAGEVVRHMRWQWDVIQRDHAITYHEHISNLSIPGTPNTSGRFVTWYDQQRCQRNDAFEAIILAVGFGREASDPSYWAHDPLDYPPASPHIHISGVGDGGLMDLIRLMLPGTSVEEICRHVSGPEWDGIRQKLADIEKQSPDDAALCNAYADLKSELPTTYRSWLQERLKPTAKVTLGGRGQFPWTRGASVLNRFIASTLGVEFVSNPPKGAATLKRHGIKKSALSKLGLDAAKNDKTELPEVAFAPDSWRWEPKVVGLYSKTDDDGRPYPVVVFSSGAALIPGGVQPEFGRAKSIHQSLGLVSEGWRAGPPNRGHAIRAEKLLDGKLWIWNPKNQDFVPVDVAHGTLTSSGLNLGWPIFDAESGGALLGFVGTQGSVIWLAALLQDVYVYFRLGFRITSESREQIRRVVDIFNELKTRGDQYDAIREVLQAPSDADSMVRHLLQMDQRVVLDKLKQFGGIDRAWARKVAATTVPLTLRRAAVTPITDDEISVKLEQQALITLLVQGWEEQDLDQSQAPFLGDLRTIEPTNWGQFIQDNGAAALKVPAGDVKAEISRRAEKRKESIARNEAPTDARCYVLLDTDRASVGLHEDFSGLLVVRIQPPSMNYEMQLVSNENDVLNLLKELGL